MTKHYAVQDWFAEIATTRGQAAAIEGVGESISYYRLAELSDYVAFALRGAGASVGTIVCIICQHPIDYIIATLAVMKAGCVTFPLDPALPQYRLEKMVVEARPKLVLSDGDHLGRLSDFMPAWLEARPLALAELIRAAPSVTQYGTALTRSTTALPVIDPDAPCYVFFTSGSRGGPKAILGRTRSVAHFIDWEIRTFNITESDTIPMLTSYGFDAILRDIFTPLLAGGKICVTKSRDLVRDPTALSEWLRETAATLWHTTPSILRSLLSLPLSGRDLPALSRVLVAGEPLLPSDVKRWQEGFGATAELINLYGPSETTMVKLFHRITAADGERSRVPIGRPMEGCRAIVLDEAGAPAGVGVIGEIYLRTPYRSLGYLCRPELTMESFIPNPLSQDPQDIIYRTGDLGIMCEDGSMAYAGRRDRQVKIRGVRVELAEVEDVLHRHELVLDVAVVDNDDGQGNVELSAYVVLGQEISFEELRRYAAEFLPEPMVPTLYLSLQRIPRTITGKLDRASLPQIQLAYQRKKAPFTFPDTPVEQAVSNIWCELLDIGRIDVHDSFFTVGGHSLLAMQVLSRIESAFDVQISLHDFLTMPTIANLANILEHTLLAKATIDEELQSIIDEIGCEEA